jgi:hypothetical protein
MERGRVTFTLALVWLIAPPPPEFAADTAVPGAVTPMAEPTCPSPLTMLSTERIDRFRIRALNLLTGTPPAPPPPVVLFLPGGPGSKLTRLSDNKVIFGEGTVSAKDLALLTPASYNVRAEVLYTYKGPLGQKFDVYKTALEKLDDVVKTAGGEPRHWGFDWRLDAGTGADDLQKMLTADYNGREILILAHSHGGVVAWKWQEQYGPSTVGHMVLLGSPLRGACGFAQVLAEGFGPAPAEPMDWLTKLIQKKLLAGIRPAAFTTPGTFLILSPQPPSTMYPEGQLDAACVDQVQLFPHKEPVATILNPQSLDFWKTPLGLKLVDEAWNDLGISKSDFWNLLDKAIKAGNATRPDLTKRKIRHMRYFYSMDYPTIRKVRLVLDENGDLASKSMVKAAGMGNDNPLPMLELGDSRVLGSTTREPRLCSQEEGEACPGCGGANAKKPSCCVGPLKGVCIDRVTLAHGDLPKSKEFQEYVTNVLGPTVRAMGVRALARDNRLRERLRTMIREEWNPAEWEKLAVEVESTATDATPIRALGRAAFGPPPEG